MVTTVPAFWVHGIRALKDLFMKLGTGGFIVTLRVARLGPAERTAFVVRLQAAELVKAIQEWTGSGVVGPIDVMGRSCAGIPGARARRCTGAKSQWRCVLGLLGQWMSWAEVAQKVSTAKQRLR